MHKHLVVACSFLGAVGCGGGSSSSPPATPVTPTSASATATLGASAQVLDLPAVGGYTEKLSLPAGTPAGAKLGVTISTQAPTGMPAPNALHLEAGPVDAVATTVTTPLAFLQLTNSTAAAETFAAYPGFSITTGGTASFPSGTYQVELYDAAAPGWRVLGAAVLVAPTLTFTGPQQAFTVPAGDTVTLALVAVQVQASGVVTLSPATTSGSPYALAVGGNVALTAVEAGYGGVFTASSGSAGVATVTPSSASATFTVAGVAAGSAQITITDSAAHSAVFYVQVSASGNGTFDIHLPDQQGVAVAIPAVAGSHVTGGTVTFPVAPAGHDYPAGTVVTVAITNDVPAGFGFTPRGTQVFGITFTSSVTLPAATLPSLPALSFTLSMSPGSIYLDGEVLAPPTAIPTCNILPAAGTNAWTVAAQGVSQGLAAGTPDGYDFWFGNSICLP